MTTDLGPAAAGILPTIAAALTTEQLAPIVDLVAYPEPDRADSPGDSSGDRVLTVHSSRGVVRLLPSGEHQVISGSDPLANTDPLAFLPYALELADPSPANRTNAYPEPARRLRSCFADPDRSPDLVVVHTPAHYFPEQGGHRGEHGSLDVIQSRAPFLVAGAGAARRGPVAGHARTTDVAATLLHLIGVPVPTGLEGTARRELTDGPPGRFVVGLLWDGAHASDLLTLAQAGELPAVAELLSEGTALTGGAVAEFPSVTLCNHTSALTGVGPGRHGILGNVFYDRARGERIEANDESTWHLSAQWLRPGVRTVFEMLGEARPQAHSVCVNEPVDRGATVSTMQLVRQLGAQASGSDAGAPPLDLAQLLPPAEDSAHLSEPAHLQDSYFRWSTQVDDFGLEQVIAAWADPASAPELTWWSSVITDAGHHAGGPRSPIARDSLRDADRRLGAFLRHLDRTGVRGEVSFLLTADHGFEAADESVTGSWEPALAEVCRRLGVTYRDEGPGFVYLNV